jgi:hypothetical protein
MTILLELINDSCDRRIDYVDSANMAHYYLSGEASSNKHRSAIPNKLSLSLFWFWMKQLQLERAIILKNSRRLEYL